ncbi:MAG: hypothetical protein SFZ23_08515 [Planctomycetota bacterium]|nr:hypothetical protein [Planctomycetota bacterium]
MILYHASDLIWASKIKGVADGLGLACRPVRTLAMLDARLGDSPVRALIVDLAAADVAIELVQHVRARQHSNDATSAATTGGSGGMAVGGSEGRIRVLAFGPHVATADFQRARDAGADEVLSRGAFDHAMEDVLMKLSVGAR